MKPHTSLIMAVSLDGKISTRDGAGPRFASEADGLGSGKFGAMPMQSLLGRAQSSRTIQHLLNTASSEKHGLNAV